MVQNFYQGHLEIKQLNGVKDLHTVLSFCSQLIYSHFHCWKTHQITWPVSLIRNIPFFPICCS